MILVRCMAIAVLAKPEELAACQRLQVVPDLGRRLLEQLGKLGRRNAAE